MKVSGGEGAVDWLSLLPFLGLVLGVGFAVFGRDGLASACLSLSIAIAVLQIVFWLLMRLRHETHERFPVIVAVGLGSCSAASIALLGNPTGVVRVWALAALQGVILYVALSFRKSM